MGAANGTFALGDILAEAYAAGETAAKSALPRAKLPKLKPPAAVQADAEPARAHLVRAGDRQVQ